MNDFTREELKLLIEALEGAWGVSSDNHLYSKIQSMIDDYCEHENTGSSSDVDYVYFCRQCNVITGIS